MRRSALASRARRHALLPWTAAIASLAGLAGCAGAPEEETATSSEAESCPPGTLLPGIDTSSAQGKISWSEVKDAGVAWAMMKATQGTYDSDSQFAASWAGAADAGVVRGAYHFFDPTIDGVAQANYFLAAMGPLAAEDLSPVLDVECPAGYLADGGPEDCLGFSGGTGFEPAAGFRTNLLNWLGTVEAATGRKPIIYTYVSFFAGTGEDGTGTNVDTTGLDAYPLWIANYTGTSCFSVPSPWTQAAAWQYDDNGTYPGIDKTVDVDRMVGPIDELLGWPGIRRPSRADVNGDGRADVCGRESTGVVCALATSGGSFGTPVSAIPWSDLAGWGPAAYSSTVQWADVNGDGRADICGRSSSGVTCAVASTIGTFGAPLTGPSWSDAAGWSNPAYYATVQLADVDGDGLADACARGPSGILCARSTGTGFAAPFSGPAWSDATGWNAPSHYRTIRFPDIDGDGRADVCGRAGAGVTCARSNGSGFGPAIAGPSWSDEAGWGAASYASTLQFPDVDGDGRADVCGRGPSGVMCALSAGSGFGAPFAGPAWSDAAGWSAPDRYATILFPDLNGDGAADVCGRDVNGMSCALSTGTGFGALFAGPTWSDAAGWTEPRYYGTIGAGDVDGDGRDDLCARGASGMECALSAGTTFGAPIAGPLWSDTSWGVAPYWETASVIGEPARAAKGLDAGAPSEDAGPIAAPDSGSSSVVVGGAVSASVSASSGCACRAVAVGVGGGRGITLLFAAMTALAARRKAQGERARSRR